jgi:hypothetical protein
MLNPIAAARHPDTQGKHVARLSLKNFVAGLNISFMRRSSSCSPSSFVMAAASSKIA